MNTCQAKVARTGKACRYQAKPDSPFCGVHGHQSSYGLHDFHDLYGAGSQSREVLHSPILITNEEVSHWLATYQQPEGQCTILPTGTRLYHGTLDCTFEKCRSPCFYGLSPIPSIAMLLEKTFSSARRSAYIDVMSEMEERLPLGDYVSGIDVVEEVRVNGCLNEYVTTEPIKVVISSAGSGSDIGRYLVGTRGYERSLKLGRPLENFAYIRKTCDDLPDQGHWLNKSTAPLISAFGNLRIEREHPYDNLNQEGQLNLRELLDILYFRNTDRIKIVLRDWELVIVDPAPAIQLVSKRSCDTHDLTIRFHEQILRDSPETPVTQEYLERTLYHTWDDLAT